jgi:hypothetical protein
VLEGGATLTADDPEKHGDPVDIGAGKYTPTKLTAWSLITSPQSIHPHLPSSLAVPDFQRGTSGFRGIETAAPATRRRVIQAPQLALHRHTAIVSAQRARYGALPLEVM